jgi:phosphodiesterase/alkaline phosphatase D-like protein
MRIAAIGLAFLAGGCALQPTAPGQRPAAYAVAPALPAPFAYGVASGDMTAESAVLWTRAARPSGVTAELSLTPGFEAPHALATLVARPEDDLTVRVLATGLSAGTKYYYRFRQDRDVSAVGTFRTAYGAAQSSTVRMAFTGDADWKWKPYPLLAALAQENLDYFLFLGDLIYESLDYQNKTVVDDLEGYRFKYRDNREPRAHSPSGMVPMRDLYGAFGQYSVFDNHETGYSPDPAAPKYNEGGGRFDATFVNKTPGYRARMQAYKEYQPVRAQPHGDTADAATAGTDRFYAAYSWGANVELIVLDDRSYRSARPAKGESPADCARTMLGAVQLAWFEKALLAARERRATWKVVVVSSPMQEFGDRKQVGDDMDGPKSWVGAYRCERNRILRFIDDNAIDNVVFLTTDNHYTAVNNLRYEGKRARNAFEILTGPLGAITGTPPYARNIDIGNLPRREADRRIVATWNGDAPDADGFVMGLAQAGLDRIGLEDDFPGLDVAGIRTLGGRAGIAEPLAFASFRSYSYAVLTFDPSHLHVQVKTMPAVADPASLLRPEALRAYEAQRPEETLSFSVRAR